MTISRNPSLTEQVAAHLKEQIVGGVFEEGRIPSETELATQLGVSRTTVRGALSRLEHEGTIIRRQGAGTFVNEQGLQIKSRLEEIWSYEQVLEDHGYTPDIKVLGVETIQADEAVARELDLEPDAEVVVMEKLFLEDRDPVILTTNRIPSRIVQGDPEEGAHLPIYEFLESRCDTQLSYYLSEIIPIALPPDVASLLNLEVGTPAVSFEEIGYDRDNRPVLQATSYFRDDLLRFRLIRRKAGA